MRLQEGKNTQMANSNKSTHNPASNIEAAGSLKNGTSYIYDTLSKSAAEDLMSTHTASNGVTAADGAFLFRKKVF